VLLLDEPLSGVEPRLRRALREEIRALQQGLGLTVVYVTHDRHEALAVSDQVVLMDAGRVVQAGTPQQLYEAPAHAFSAAFMGEATVLAGRRDGEGRVCIGPLQLPRLHPGPAGPVQVAVRPEAWRLHPCHAPGLPGTVTRRRYLGRAMEYLLATPAGPVLVHAAQTRRWHEVGAPLSLGLAPRGAWVLA
jgi:iron(III) transport system ATP-binding protein